LYGRFTLRLQGQKLTSHPVHEYQTARRGNFTPIWKSFGYSALL